jgi:hypothetical protein
MRSLRVFLLAAALAALLLLCVTSPALAFGQAKKTKGKGKGKANDDDSDAAATLDNDDDAEVAEAPAAAEHRYELLHSFAVDGGVDASRDARSFKRRGVATVRFAGRSRAGRFNHARFRSVNHLSISCLFALQTLTLLLLFLSLGTVSFDDATLDDADAKALAALSTAGGYYRVWVRAVDEGDKQIAGAPLLRAAVSACALLASGFREQFLFHSDS